MDAECFDALAQACSDVLPRRDVLGLALAGALGLFAPDAALAKKKRRRRKKKRQACVRQCAASRACGSDGCGGSCGSCASGEACQGGQCVASCGQQTCDDGIACTVDRCDAGGQTCTNTPNDSLCPGDRICDPQEGCRCPTARPDACGDACIAEGASCQTGLLGVCADGTQQCVDNEPTCVQNVQASAEVCDGLDNDCDGVVDNGFPIGQACDGNDQDQDLEGVWVCDASGGVTCTDNTG